MPYKSSTIQLMCWMASEVSGMKEKYLLPPLLTSTSSENYKVFVSEGFESALLTGLNPAIQS